MKIPKKNQLSPKYTINSDEEMPAQEATSIVIQALTGGVTTDMRDEFIIGCLKHISGDKVIYDKYARTFIVTSTKNNKKA